MMSDIAKFIQARQIDSLQKLHLVLFLYQHPESSWTSQQMAEQLFLGDVPWLEEMVADLQAAGLVDCTRHGCKACDEAGLRECLHCLVETCENPLARQEILNWVRHSGRVPHRYQETAHEPH
jgi:hypothetical protein